MSVYNEYSKLKTILIGKLLPTECLKELALPSDKDILPTLIKIHEETNKDLDALQKFFEGKGIKVYRPNINKYYEEVRDKTKSALPNPSTIRDWCFSYGDDIILSKTYCPNRWYEWLYWKDVFDELEEQGKTIHHIVDENEFDFDVFAKISNSLLDRYETYSQRRVLKDLKFNFSQIQNINSEWDEIRKSYYKKTIKDLYISKDNPRFKDEVEPTYIYSNSALKKYPLTHTSSYLKHDGKIISSPLGNKKGYSNFKKILLSKYDINFCNILGESGCITKSSNPICSDLIMTDLYDRFSPNIIKHSVTGTKTFQDYQMTNPRLLLTPSRHNNHINLTIDPDSKINTYMRVLCDKEDQYNLEYNAITYEPYKTVGGIFGDSRDYFMYVQNIRAHNLGLRHQSTLKRDIRCYTIDIDREDSLDK